MKVSTGEIVSHHWYWKPLLDVLIQRRPNFCYTHRRYWLRRLVFAVLSPFRFPKRVPNFVTEEMLDALPRPTRPINLGVAHDAN